MKDARCLKPKMDVLTVETMGGTRRQWRILVPRRTTVVGGHADKCVPPTNTRCNNAVAKRRNTS